MSQQFVPVFSGAGTGDGTTLNPKAGVAQTYTFQVVLTSTGTLSIKSTIDGATFDTLNVTKQDTGVQYTSITAPGTYEVDVTGRYGVKPNVSANGSGVAITASLSDGGGSSGGGGGGGGAGAVTVADGADVNAGTTTDAAVVTDANGTMSGKLRGLVKLLASTTFKAASTPAADADTALVIRSSAIGDRADAAWDRAAAAASLVQIAKDQDLTLELIRAAVTNAAFVSLIDLNKVGGAAVTANSGNVGAGSPRVVVATDQPILTTAFPSNAKGSQGATGLAVQALKDSGRASVTLTVDKYQVAAVAETLINTMQSSADNGAHSGNLTTYPVTAGKRFRLQSIVLVITTTTGNTTNAGCYIRIRANNAGAAIITSPVQFVAGIAGLAAANTVTGSISIPLPDGFEFVAGAGIGITVECPGYVVTTAAPLINATLIGYEY